MSESPQVTKALELLGDGRAEVDLYGYNLNDDGVAVLALAINNSLNLQSLVLSYNNIGDNGVLALAEELRVNTVITSLE